MLSLLSPALSPEVLPLSDDVLHTDIAKLVLKKV